MNHEQRFQLCLKLARGVFEKQGSHIPQITSFSDAMGNKLMFFPNLNDKVKDVAEEMMVKEAREGADAVCWTCEAWMLKGSKEEVEGQRPSESPDRIEILLVTYEGKDVQWSAIAEIHRDGDSVTLGEWQIDRALKNEGRFTNIWRKAGTSGETGETV